MRQHTRPLHHGEPARPDNPFSPSSAGSLLGHDGRQCSYPWCSSHLGGRVPFPRHAPWRQPCFNHGAYDWGQTGHTRPPNGLAWMNRFRPVGTGIGYLCRRSSSKSIVMFPREPLDSPTASMDDEGDHDSGGDPLPPGADLAAVSGPIDGRRWRAKHRCQWHQRCHRG